MSYDSAADTSTFRVAVGWVEQLLLGSIATSIAALAIAVVGMMMLTGRADWRRGARVIAGCFIIFGAGAIGNGLRGMGASTEEAVPVAPPPREALAPPARSAEPFDPYAGAALVRRPLSKDDLRAAPVRSLPDDAYLSQPLSKR